MFVVQLKRGETAKMPSLPARDNRSLPNNVLKVELFSIHEIVNDSMAFG